MDPSAARSTGGEAPRKLRIDRAKTVVREVVLDTLNGGTIRAGNLAYLSVVTLFPLVILVTAATGFFGRTDAGHAAIHGLLSALPPQASRLLGPVIHEVLRVRTGNLLWVGAAIALWTVTGFVETIRGIFYDAYEKKLDRPFWVYRLFSMGATLLAMVVLIVAFISQLFLRLLLDTLQQYFPYTVHLPSWIKLSTLVPPVIIFLALWALFKLLAPRGFREFPAWPGALLTSCVWILAASLIGPIMSTFGNMALTYGTLSGVMLTMLFFYIVGLALVVGAQLNAALANSARVP